VARTWVELGHYGRLLAGQPISARLSAAFPVVAPIALSFRLFGVGIWQGRLVVVLHTLASLLLLYYLARRLYNRRIAAGTLAVVLLMSPFPDVHPLVTGRVVWAETPMLFFLLAGYVCFLLTSQRSMWFMLLAVVLWGIGLNTKAQPLPFWTVSLVVPLLVMLLKRRWKVACLLSIGLIGSLGAKQLLLRLWQLVVMRDSLPNGPLTGLPSTAALVPIAQVRLVALTVALTIGLPTALGLCNATWETIKKHRDSTLNADLDVVRLALLSLAGSWFAWYVLLSIGWTRYLFPPMFLGSMFAAAWLYDLTDGYSASPTMKRACHALRCLHFDRQGAGALLAVVLVATTVLFTVYILGLLSVMNSGTPAQQVAHFLNTQTAPNALIEAYSPEVFFLLDRSYHYPPDQVNVQIIRRLSWGQDVPIDYDPLSADPDYLVVCRRYGLWMIYEAVLESDAFHLLFIDEPYELYERVR